MRYATSLSCRVIVGWIFLGLCSGGYAVEPSARQYTLLEAASDTKDYEKEGKAFLDIVDVGGPIRHFLYYTSATKACPKTITPESLEKGVRLVGSAISGDVLAVKSNKWDPKKPSEPKTIQLKVLDQLGVFSNDYRKIPVQIEFNRERQRWELKYKNEVVKSAKFVTAGENKIKEVLFGDGAICEIDKDGNKICESMGTCRSESK